MIYYIAAVDVSICLFMIIVLVMRKMRLTLITTSPLMLLSFYFIYQYIDANIFNNPCDGATDCMNETGLWIVLTLLTMGVTVVLFLVSLLISEIFKSFKKEKS